jgi:hypothetical protein
VCVCVCVCVCVLVSRSVSSLIFGGSILIITLIKDFVIVSTKCVDNITITHSLTD